MAIYSLPPDTVSFAPEGVVWDVDAEDEESDGDDGGGCAD